MRVVPQVSLSSPPLEMFRDGMRGQHSQTFLVYASAIGIYAMFEAQALDQSVHMLFERQRQHSAVSKKGAGTSGDVKQLPTMPPAPGVGSNLGPLEPPGWVGRCGMAAIIMLVLHADLSAPGGILHGFVSAPDADVVRLLRLHSE